MNLGLSPELKLAFPNINISKPKNNSALLSSSPFIDDIDPNWVSGFASGEGSFQVDIIKIKKFDNKYQVSLRFSIGQHSRNELLLKSLANYLKCGRVKKK
jgi:hypothetical protein